MSDGPRIVNEPESAPEETLHKHVADVIDEVAEQVASLAAAMRTVGAGRARLGDLELDLTVPPATLVEKPGEFAPDNETAVLKREREAEARNAKHEGVLFAAAGGHRMKLPLM